MMTSLDIHTYIGFLQMGFLQMSLILTLLLTPLIDLVHQSSNAVQPSAAYAILIRSIHQRAHHKFWSSNAAWTNYQIITPLEYQLTTRRSLSSTMLPNIAQSFVLLYIQMHVHIHTYIFIHSRDVLNYFEKIRKDFSTFSTSFHTH